MRGATDQSVSAVGNIETTIAEIDAIASSIAAAVVQQGLATAEIARSVTNSVQAADVITSRIREVSAEAKQNGQQAAQVDENAAGLAAAVSALKRTVVRVVRTSTAEVNRRHGERHVVSAPARVILADQSQQSVRVIDLSEGGARLQGLTVAHPGTRGTLLIDGTAMKLVFVVRDVADGACGVAFALDDESAAGHPMELKGLLARR